MVRKKEAKMIKWLSDKFGKKEKSTPTVIGAGAEFVGDINTDHTVHIQGTFEGRITADAVVIGKLGSVRGKVNANQVYIYGNMNGTTQTDEAHIFDGAVVMGDLHYHRLNIANNEGIECRLVRTKNK